MEMFFLSWTIRGSSMVMQDPWSISHETNISIQFRVPVALSLRSTTNTAIHVEGLRRQGQEEK